jgi:hypothetical protein
MDQIVKPAEPLSIFFTAHDRKKRKSLIFKTGMGFALIGFITFTGA